jgi:hypothetical protein
MGEMQTDKYIRTNTTLPSFHAEVTAPIPILFCDENYGNKGFLLPYFDFLDF